MLPQAKKEIISERERRLTTADGAFNYAVAIASVRTDRKLTDQEGHLPESNYRHTVQLAHNCLNFIG